MNILKVKRPNGETVNVPFGVGADGKSAYEYAQEGGYTGSEEEFAHDINPVNIKNEVTPIKGEDYWSPEDQNSIIETIFGALTLGMHTDGLIYLFRNGKPVGDGLNINAEVVEGDVYGYIDENNNIVLRGAVADGKYIVKYQMENGNTIDIGDMNIDTNIYYNITNNLTNCSNGNTVTNIVSGESYSATITVNDGCELSSIVVIMNGIDVTSSVTNSNNIYIESVIGDITITAICQTPRTNFFKATPIVYTTKEASQDVVVGGGRVGSDNTYRTDSGANNLLSNYIPVQNGDEIVFINATATGPYSAAYNELNSTNAEVIFKPGVENDAVSYTDNNNLTVTSDYSYMRFACGPDRSIMVDGSASTVDAKYDLTKIVINIKRNGEWL